MTQGRLRRVLRRRVVVKGMAGSVSRTRKYVRENAFSKKELGEKGIRRDKAVHSRRWEAPYVL